MCDECARLQRSYLETTDRLRVVQQELARYGINQESGAFMKLWNECTNALRKLFEIREQMAQHSLTHM